MNSAYWRLYVPKLITVLRDGYDGSAFSPTSVLA
jgi:hypothetical protein